MQANQKLIERLVDNGVEFVIVGGFAAVVHGVTLVTKDLDLCISLSKKNFKAILKAFQGLNPCHKLIKKTILLETTAEELKKYKNLYLTTDIGFVDFLGTIKDKQAIIQLEAIRQKSKKHS